MSRKHFILIAAAIRENLPTKEQREQIAKALIPALRASNPNFNAARFIDTAVGN